MDIRLKDFKNCKVVLEIYRNKKLYAYGYNSENVDVDHKLYKAKEAIVKSILQFNICQLHDPKKYLIIIIKRNI